VQNGFRGVLPSAAAVGAAWLLVACAETSVYRLPEVMGKVRNDLGLASRSILDQERCRVGEAFVGAPSVALRQCLYVATDSRAIIVTYDRRSSRYRIFAAIDIHSRGVALKLHRSLFGKLEQIQIRNDDGYLILDFSDSCLNAQDCVNSLPRAYEYLTRLGVPKISGREFVPERTGPGPILIPVYVPAR
jgi:hypothetical protein